jgi:hypothetical protein
VSKRIHNLTGDRDRKIQKLTGDRDKKNPEPYRRYSQRESKTLQEIEPKRIQNLTG